MTMFHDSKQLHSIRRLLLPATHAQRSLEDRFRGELTLGFGLFELLVTFLAAVTELGWGTPGLGWLYLATLFPLVGLLAWMRRGGDPVAVGSTMVGLMFLVLALTNVLTGGKAIGANIAIPTVALVAVMISPPRLAWAWLVLIAIQIALAAWMRSHGVISPLSPDPTWVQSATDRVPLFFSLGSAVIGWTMIRALENYRLNLIASRQAEADADARAAFSTERFISFAEVAADGFWETDEELRLSFVSRSFADAMGLGAEQMIGLTPGEAYLKRFPEAPLINQFMEPLIRRQAFSDLLFPVLDLQGMRAWLRCLGRPVFDADGAFAGFRGVVRDVTQQRRYEREIRKNAERLRLITENLPATIVYYDAQERYQFCNELACQVLGLPREQLIGRTMLEVRGEAIYSGFREHVAKTLAGEGASFEGDGYWKGKHYYFQTNYIPDVNEEGKVQGFYSATFDITTIKNSEAAIKEAASRLSLITDSVPAHIYHVDAERLITFSNRASQDMVGKPADEIEGQPVSSMYGAAVFPLLEAQLESAFSGQQETFEYESGKRHFRATFLPETGESGVHGVYGLVSDITPFKQIEMELRRLSLFDPLTGLPNRRRFIEKLDEAISRSERTGEVAGLIFLDLDHFKPVNDNFGHEVGDEILKTFGSRISASIRKTDTVCRLAGDEFVVILENLGSEHDATLVAQKITAAMSPSVEIGGHTLTLSTSMGIAIRKPGEKDGDALLRKADAALYVAKNRERGSYELAT
jgi:diguanylate cyclase (GGDEF)-like protein/PAS domain S-box-containing protein